MVARPHIIDSTCQFYYMERIRKVGGWWHELYFFFWSLPQKLGALVRNSRTKTILIFVWAFHSILKPFLIFETCFPTFVRVLVSTYLSYWINGSKFWKIIHHFTFILIFHGRSRKRHGDHLCCLYFYQQTRVLCMIFEIIFFYNFTFFCICPPPGLLPVLGPRERYIYAKLKISLSLSYK